MSNLQQTLETLIGTVARNSPELNQIRDRFDRGEITETEALNQMVEVAAQDPEVLALIEQQRATPETRLPRLPPLTEAALAERAQFDGDMPELRTGPLLPGTKPSVPVRLSGARNPVVGGLLLQQASAEMKTKIEAHEATRQAQSAEIVQKALNGMNTAAEALLKIEDPEISALVAGNASTDLPEYKRGQLPVPVSVAAPAGAVLAALTPEQARQAAWMLLSTTQGRRSALSVIELLIQKDLERHGIRVTCRAATESQESVAAHEWKVALSGAGATQPAFSFIDMAAKVLSAGLRKKVPAGGYVLETAPVNRISDREVGWAARLFHSP